MSAPWTFGNGECENCGHYFMEGLTEGVCQGCIEAYPEDFADLKEDDPKPTPATELGK